MKNPNARQLKKAEKALLLPVPKPISPFRSKVRKPQSETKFAEVKSLAANIRQAIWDAQASRPVQVKNLDAPKRQQHPQRKGL
jgi:hypothetical protein